MTVKELFMDSLKTFFIVVTLINIVMLVIGSYFFPDALFDYSAFFAPLFYGFIGTLPNIVMYSPKELSLKSLIIRKIVQLILIEVLVLFAIFFQSGQGATPAIVFSTAFSIFMVYCIATLIDWIQNTHDAKSINKDLLNFQKEVTPKN